MSPDETAFSDLLDRLARRPRDVTFSIRFASDDGTTALNIVSVQPEMIGVRPGTAEILLSGSLGRLTLDARDLTGHAQSSTGHSWRLHFGPLSITVEFSGGT